MGMSAGVGVRVWVRDMEGCPTACMLGGSSVEGRICVLCWRRDEGCLRRHRHGGVRMA